MRPTDELVDALGDCDAVVLALPDTEPTRGMFGRAAIDALPRHGIVVNVGRGSTLDEGALVAALREHRLAGAALDVFAAEPLPEDRFRRGEPLRNVVDPEHFY